MANILTEVTPKLLAQGLMALRENAVTPRLVNRQYEGLAGQKGSTIDVPIPSAIQAQAVSPSATPPATADVAPESVPIALDQWFEAPFYMTDKDILEAQEGTLPMQASEAIKAIANNVDQYILGLYKGIYGYTGVTNAIAFAADTSDGTQLRRVLNNQLAPMDPRYGIVSPDVEASMLQLRAFQDSSWAGDTEAIREGRISRRLGFDWFMNQNIPTHTMGTAISGGSTITLVSDSDAGDTSVTLAVGSGTATLVKGDVISIAGDSENYTVTSNSVTLTTSGVAVSISPKLRVAVDGSSTAVAVTGHPAPASQTQYEVNLGMHRDAIAFATRPLANPEDGLGAVVRSAADPVSGLTLRLEVTREHKRTRWSFDILYGAQLVRPELAARLVSKV